MVLATSPAQASGLRNDYVRASDGSLEVITAYDQTRSGDGLYVYDSSWGSSTGQNQWGAEAVVENGTITALTTKGTGGNAPIPVGGFTLSGFGSGATWMTAHLAIGQPVTIEKDQILTTTATATTTVTSIDPTPPFGFPGGRGSNQLIVYTNAYGSATTGTNQYGTEAIATAATGGYRVVSIGGNNSTIPANGIVLSGHGTQQTWIQKSLIVGSLITVDTKNATVSETTDATSYLFRAAQGIQDAQQKLTAARNDFADAPLQKAQKTLDDAKAQLQSASGAHASGDDLAAITTADEATQTALTAGQLTMESSAVETRAVWHRPSEDTPADVENTVAAMAGAGFNQLYLESFWGGRTIYPSNLAEQNSHFVGWDPLAAYVDACKRHGISLHLWMHTFYVGTADGDGSGSGNPVAQQHPDWLVVDKAGRDTSVTEPGYYFIDPAVTAARTWLLDLFSQAVTRYDVAGLQLDYIRYPKQGADDTTTSYNAVSRAAFKETHGVDPASLTPSDPEYKVWQDWETTQVTSFVKDVRAKVPTSTILSSALETADNAADVANFHQDFATWVTDGLLQTVAPEVYTAGVSDVLQQSKAFVSLIGNNAFTSIGLAPAFVGATPNVAVQETAATREAGATGNAEFVWKSLSPAYQEALARSVYRRPAIDPQNDPVRASVVEVADMLRRVDTVYGIGLDKSTQKRFARQLTALQRALDHADVKQGNERAAAFRKTLATADAPAAILDRLDHDLDLVTHILAVAKSSAYAGRSGDDRCAEGAGHARCMSDG
ncbi:hypothetical protein BH11ACT1_BH11ACT1_08580 [soil metagenome]